MEFTELIDLASERLGGTVAANVLAHGTGALPPGVEGGLDAQAVYSD